MRTTSISDRKGEEGFGIWTALVFLILIGLIVAAAMKAIAIWAAIGVFILAVIVIGLIANAADISRYMRISSM